MATKLAGVLIILLATSSRCYCGVYLTPASQNNNDRTSARLRNSYLKSDYFVDFDALRYDLMQDLGLSEVPSPAVVSLPVFFFFLFFCSFIKCSEI
jgi:hypothetical protein